MFHVHKWCETNIKGEAVYGKPNWPNDTAIVYKGTFKICRCKRIKFVPEDKILRPVLIERNKNK